MFSQIEAEAVGQLETSLLIEIRVGGAFAGEQQIGDFQVGLLEHRGKIEAAAGPLEVGFIYLVGAKDERVAGDERLIEGAIVAGGAGSRRSAAATTQEPEHLRVQRVKAHRQDISFAEIVVQLQETAVIVVGAQRTGGFLGQAVETLDRIDGCEVIENDR